jgi:hypothetical protein
LTVFAGSICRSSTHDRTAAGGKAMRLKREYSKGPQNIIENEYQVIRLSEGCPWYCPWCYEGKEIGDDWKVFGIPELVRTDVRITDMNLLAKKEALDIIKKFKDIRVDGKVVYPWLVCGIDYRFLTHEIATALKDSRFVNMHVAWDHGYSDQKLIKKAIDILRRVGYEEISVFMICNHYSITYRESVLKLNLCKYWDVKVNDCYFDNQTPPKITPIGWDRNEIREFRASVRKHNQLINFGIDPEADGLVVLNIKPQMRLLKQEHP